MLGVFPHCPPPWYLRWSLSLNLQLTFWPGWMVREILGSICLCLPMLWVAAGICCCTWLFHLGTREFEFRTSCFHSKCPYPLHHVPVPQRLFLKTRSHSAIPSLPSPCRFPCSFFLLRSGCGCLCWHVSLVLSSMHSLAGLSLPTELRLRAALITEAALGKAASLVDSGPMPSLTVCPLSSAAVCSFVCHCLSSSFDCEPDEELAHNCLGKGSSHTCDICIPQALAKT